MINEQICLSVGNNTIDIRGFGLVLLSLIISNNKQYDWLLF